MNGLDFSALTLYLPGAVNTAGTSGTTSIERSTYFTDTPNMNGNRAQANNYTLDGIDMNETYNNLISYSPAPEALQEIQVMTANSPTDYGNVNGAGVVSVLKSGTNQFPRLGLRLRAGLSDWTPTPTRTRPDNTGNPHQPIFSRNSEAQSAGPSCTTSCSSLAITWDRAGTRAEPGHGKRDDLAMRSGDFSVLLAARQPHTTLRSAQRLRRLQRQPGRPDHQSGSQDSSLRIRSSTHCPTRRLPTESRRTIYQAPIAQLQGQ